MPAPSQQAHVSSKTMRYTCIWNAIHARRCEACPATMRFKGLPIMIFVWLPSSLSLISLMV
jgi:hypothetical protein